MRLVNPIEYGERIREALMARGARILSGGVVDPVPSAVPVNGDREEPDQESGPMELEW